MQIMAATRRLRSAKLTSQSITEQHSASDDDAIAGLDAAGKNGLVALLESDFDGPRLERPRRDLDQHLIGVVFHHQRAGRYHRRSARRRMKTGAREHAWLQARIGIGKGDADFG